MKSCELIDDAAVSELTERAKAPGSISDHFDKWLSRVLGMSGCRPHGEYLDRMIEIWVARIRRADAEIWRDQVERSTAAVIESWA